MFRGSLVPFLPRLMHMHNHIKVNITRMPRLLVQYILSWNDFILRRFCWLNLSKSACLLFCVFHRQSTFAWWAFLHCVFLHLPGARLLFQTLSLTLSPRLDTLDALTTTKGPFSFRNKHPHLFHMKNMLSLKTE